MEATDPFLKPASALPLIQRGLMVGSSTSYAGWPDDVPKQ